MIRYPKPRSILLVCFSLGAALLGSGAAEAGLWSYRQTQDPALQGASLEGDFDPLPPGWTMNRMDPSGQMGPARRDPDVVFDPTLGQVRESYTQGGVETQPPMVSSVDQYSTHLTTRNIRRLWRDGSRESRSITRSAAKHAGKFNYTLPIQLPKFARGFLGDGAPNIDVSGSE